ncbi:MAG TPA: PIN domain-containing protein [Gammaproteobacteria bacterium]|nr:PIN domain-containing protein [Gammaproteobacteria bacterium]
MSRKTRETKANEQRIAAGHPCLALVRQPERRLKKPGREAIERAIAGGSLRISVMTVWEISQLDALGRIYLGAPIDELMEKALALPALQCLQLAPALIFDAHRLPGDFHRDPIDRLLVATARHHGLTLITEDCKILDSARQGYVRARSSSDKELLKP